MAVFPGLQGGPHNNNIAGIAVAMKMAATEEFKVYQRQVVANARALCQGLIAKGYKISSGGSDNHMLLLDLSPKKLSGSKGERILEEISISCNKNTGEFYTIRENNKFARYYSIVAVPISSWRQERPKSKRPQVRHPAPDHQRNQGGWHRQDRRLYRQGYGSSMIKSECFPHFHFSIFLRRSSEHCPGDPGRVRPKASGLEEGAGDERQVPGEAPHPEGGDGSLRQRVPAPWTRRLLEHIEERTRYICKIFL